MKARKNKEAMEGFELEAAEETVLDTDEKPKTYAIPDGVRVLIATPNYTNLFSSETHSNHIECVSAWARWGLQYKWMIVGRTFVHFARSQQCQAAIDGGFSHIYWVDDDAIINPEHLIRMLSHDKDVVITPYPMRRSPFEIGILSAQQYICRRCDGLRFDCSPEVTPPPELPCPECGEDAQRNFHEHASYRNLKVADMDQGLVSVDGGGTHAMLIKTSILTEKRGHKPPPPNGKASIDNDSYPPGAIELYAKLGDVFQDKGERHLIDHYFGELPDESLTFAEEADGGAKPFFIMPKVGTEDMLWCYRAKKKRIEIFADTDIFADHVGFPPVISRGFTEKAEQIVPGQALPGEVALMKVGDRGRDHTAIRVETATSLT